MVDIKSLASLKNTLLAAIVNSSDDAIISKDLSGTITSWNLAAERIFGYKQQEAIGKSIYLIIPKDHLDEEKFILSQIRAGNRLEHFETVRQRKDGTLFPVSITVSPVKDETGIVIGASKILRDITIQKKDEEKKIMLSAIIQSSNDAIISKNLDGVITSWNPTAERMFGYTEKEAVGRNITILIPPDKLSEEKTIISKIRAGEAVEHYETVRMTKAGKEIHVSLTVSPIRDSKGKVIGASKIARDITERIEIENKLLEQTKLLEKLNASKDEFIGIASHELKTPITSIKAYLQLLERSLVDSMHQDFVKRTLSYINKLNGLVGDLLDVSKIQAGKLQLNIVPFDLNDTVNQAIEAVNHTHLSHRILREGKSRSLILEADPVRIEQVLNNFFTNAIKYSPGADKVIVKVEQDNENVVISVQDFGIGIAREHLDKIFSRFYRVKGMSPEFTGMGIGLYISHEIIERHRGKIWVESEPKKGSTFYFSIPCFSVD